MATGALPRFAAGLVLAASLFGGARPLGPLPPLGGFLDPANGVWAVGAHAELPSNAVARIPGLEGRVSVLYDDRAVPHIFATSEADAYRALGYVVARDRLFQLELQTLAGAGRLTEVAGRIALGADHQIRDLGLTRAAERKMAALDPRSGAGSIVNAYADGVNAYIDHLHPRDWPLENHLLNRKPARWEPINSLHLFHRMGWTLAFSEHELARLRIQARVGKAAADALFPVNSPIQEPIQPNGRHAPRDILSRIPPPGAPDTAALALVHLLEIDGRSFAMEGVAGEGTDDGVGSNNWVAGPRRTKEGHPVMAGDPHLDLTLPSIWYEAHLVVPGRLDVYGVTIPGASAIIIGFNRDIAWSLTNTEADVLDYYVETVDDPAHPQRYRLDGAWRPLEFRVETYRGKRGEVLEVDTVRYTHRGPVHRVGNRWISLRWTVTEDQRFGDNFNKADRAGSASEFEKAMEPYGAPAQNMLVADRQGHIAIRSTGHYPIRPGDGRGDYLRDGASTRSDWKGFWPLGEYPQAFDPAQGYLASANQQPIDPQVNPRYLGANWYSPWRALRINALLRADSQVTPDSMRRYQTDPGSPRADLFVPALLTAATKMKNDDTLARAAMLLGQWDRRYTKDNRRAVLFEAAMDELGLRLWDELRPAGDVRPGPSPGAAVVASLLHDPDNLWWDDRHTAPRERRDDILAASLKAGYLRVVATRGDPEGSGWLWRNVQQANIRHLLRIPALSALGIPMQGGPSTLNPSAGDGSFGSSWRMVVELGPEVHGWGTYPGGQSGNPASARYLDRLPRWIAGELDSLRFPKTPEEIPSPRFRLTLEASR